MRFMSKENENFLQQHCSRFQVIQLCRIWDHLKTSFNNIIFFFERNYLYFSHQTKRYLNLPPRTHFPSLQPKFFALCANLSRLSRLSHPPTLEVNYENTPQTPGLHGPNNRGILVKSWIPPNNLHPKP
jgi:hypothetical protein